ncbi:MAG: hypothetical protein NVS4B2_22060 [Chloroflexota bacterium]
MRIGIDAAWASAAGTGTASYTEGLVRALARHNEHELVLYFRPGDQQANPLYDLDAPNVDRRVVGGRGQAGRTLVTLSRVASRDRLDIFHSPGFFLPPCRVTRVVTFHDVNMFLQWDKWWRPGMRLGWLSLAAQTLASSRWASRIFADSGHAATSVRRVLHLDHHRVDVLYPGVDDRYFNDDSARSENRPHEYDLSRYLLYVGVLSPQKNLEGIVRAFAQLDRPDLTLAIAGRVDGPYFQQHVRPLIIALGVAARVSVLGVVPPVYMRSLYAGASAFLFPSFGEGFGLGPLEAMASGTPVVASNTSSLPEVLGDAALLVDPADVGAIAAATDRLLRDPDLRDTLVSRGCDRARSYRWSVTAARALELYASVA